MNIDKHAFSQRLKKTLKLKRIRQYQLAKLTGIAAPCISQYATGKRFPQYVHLKLIAKALGVTEDYLVHGIGLVPDESPVVASAAVEELDELIKEASHEELQLILNFAKMIVKDVGGQIVTTKSSEEVVISKVQFERAAENRIPREIVVRRVKGGMSVERAITKSAKSKRQLSETELLYAESKGIPREVAKARFGKHGWPVGSAINTPYTKPIEEEAK